MYDALLILSFGGPEGPDDVIPFLENVLRGRNVPRERMLEVAEHYYHFGGKSPINEINRQLIAALTSHFQQHGPELPIYWGNRNWHPMLPDTVQQMAADGVRRALVFATSAFGSYSGCRQYLDNLAAARQAVGTAAPELDKLRIFYNHPGFLLPMVERTAEALEQLGPQDRPLAHVVYTAHSIPTSMAAGSGYVRQLQMAAEFISQRLQLESWSLAYQSRSGPPSQPWLEPDIRDELDQLKSRGIRQVVVVPLGFLCDHLEVLFDLDTEAQAHAQALGLKMVRAGTVGCHPRFVEMIRELVLERLEPGRLRLVLGDQPVEPDVCPASCCPAPARR